MVGIDVGTAVQPVLTWKNGRETNENYDSNDADDDDNDRASPDNDTQQMDN